jgi:hypothetical protein
MKTSVLLIAASAAMTVFFFLAAGNTYGMGAKGNAVQQQEKSVSGQPCNEQPGNGTREDISSETSGTVNRNGAAPKKKPRLKYPDERGCPC